MNRSPGSANASLEGRTILVLEDESLIVLDLTLALESGGARVLAAADERGALRLVGSRRIDAAILDLTLADGQTCEGVAARLDEIGVPYLVHTGDVPRHEPLLTRLGAPVLTKPFPSHRIAEHVVQLIETNGAG